MQRFPLVDVEEVFENLLLLSVQVLVSHFAGFGSSISRHLGV